MGQRISYHGNVIFRLSAGRIAEVWSVSSLGDWVAAQQNGITAVRVDADGTKQHRPTASPGPAVEGARTQRS